MTKKYLLGALLLSSFIAVAADPKPKETVTKSSAPAPAKATSIEVLRKDAGPIVKVQITRCNAGPGGHCVLDLTVKPGCVIEISDPEFQLEPGQKAYTSIKTPGWKFDPTEGIKLKNPKAPFTGSLHNPTTWVVEANAGSKGLGRFPYGVKVSKDGQVCSFDPGYWV